MGKSKSIIENDPSDALRDWYQSSLGGKIAACEKKMADALIHNAFGYHLVQIGFDASVKLYETSPVSHKVMVCPKISLGMDQQTIIAQSHELPILDNSQDVVILHHTLDFAEHPHQTLREASRILRQGGHLLIVSFNPNSFWGVCRRCHRNPSAPWTAQGFSHWRLHDWIRLLDLTELKSVSDFHSPPIENERWFNRLGFMNRWVSRLPAHTGSILMMWVRKDVVGMTPLKPVWKTRKLIAFPVAEPSARNKSARGRSI